MYLVNFMYNGEISIPRDNMDDFLAVAEQFKIRGLYNEQPQRKIPRQIQQYRHGGMPGPGRQHPPPRPQPAMVPPDIRNRLPPGKDTNLNKNCRKGKPKFSKMSGSIGLGFSGRLVEFMLFGD